MHTSLIKNIDSDFELQVYYLTVLMELAKINIKPKQVNTLAALCMYTKETRAITNSAKKKARLLTNDSPSRFSNSFKELTKIGGLIEDDIIHKKLYVPNGFQGFKINIKRKETNEDIQIATFRREENNDGVLSSDQKPDDEGLYAFLEIEMDR